RFVDDRLRAYGFNPHNGLRDMVKRALHPAYRDACLEAEEQLQATRLRPTTSSFRTASPGQSTAANATGATTTKGNVQSDSAVPADASSSTSPCRGQAMSDFIEQAILDLAADEKWDAKSGRQARSTVA